MEIDFPSDGVTLRGYLAKPPVTAVRAPRPALVLCHGFPFGPLGAATTGESYPELADRLARDVNWTVLSFNFRGTGGSGGNFSIGGWLADARAAIDRLLEEPVSALYLAGFSTGGSIAVCVAGADTRVAGVAALAAPADFHDWSADPRRFLDHARALGVVKDPAFPRDFETWARELRDTRPVIAAATISPRPFLLVHGTEDDAVALADARILADASENSAELKVIVGAGHRLRHDPRAIALLVGWMHRQPPVIAAAASIP